MYDEKINFDDDKDKSKKRRWLDKIDGPKAVLFVVGWLTIPFITGGVWYDMFGGLSFGELLHRLIHPKELLNSLGIYTLAFIIFTFLPEKYRKANLFLKIVYFIFLYILLKVFVNTFLW